MARGIPAIVTPEVLQWARDLDRITIDEIAQKLNVDAAARRQNHRVLAMTGTAAESG